MLYASYITIKLEGKKSQGPTLDIIEISKLLAPLYLLQPHSLSHEMGQEELQMDLICPPPTPTQGCRCLGRKPFSSLSIISNRLLPIPPHSASFSSFGMKFLTIGTFGSYRTYHSNLNLLHGKTFDKFKVLCKQG